MFEGIRLGESKVIVSRLAIGTGTNGWGGVSDQTRKGAGWLSDLLVQGFQQGICYWDLADQYGTHDEARQALTNIDRASVVISTKTTTRSYDECSTALDRFRDELETDYLDIVLLHGLTATDWPKTHAGAMEALTEARAGGTVRAVGISSHSLGALGAAADNPWVDIVLVRLNGDGINMDASPSQVVPVLERAHAAGKGITAMKVLGCGALADDAAKAISFVADLDCVDAMTVGFTSHKQMSFAAKLLGAGAVTS